MAQVDGSIRIGTEITTKQAEKELKSLEGSIAKTAEKIASLRSKMDALKDTKLPTQEYKEIQNQIESTEKKINDLLAKQEKFLATGGKTTSSAYKKMEYDLEELKNSLPYLKSELQDLVESGNSFTLGSDTEKYAQMASQMQQLNQQMESDTQRQSELQSKLASEEERLAQIKTNATISDQQILDLMKRRKQLLQEIAELEKAGVGLGYKEYDSANQELAQINNQIRAYKDNLSKVPEKFSNMQKSAKKAFDAVSNVTKKSSGLFSTFVSRFKGLALSLLIFNQISKAFNAMISGMKTGFTNFMNYSDSFANSAQGMKNAMSTLGNQFAAAFAPIVQMIIPWLTKLVSAISTAMTYVAQFIAILGGKSTFTRAKQVQDSYNKSLGGTAAAAKKAYGALAKFDDLDVLQKKEDDSADSGGAGGAARDMFEEVPVDSKLKDWLDGILEKLKPILDYLKKLKDIFMEGFWDGLGDWEYRWEIIKNSLASIKESLIDIFTDPAVVAAADRWAQSVAYMLGSLVGSLASIGLTIAANLLGGIALYLEQNKDRIKDFLVDWFDVRAEINYLFADLFQSIAYVFEAFASQNGQQLTANLIGIFVDAFMGLELIVDKFTRDILNIFIQPFVENKEGFRTALEGFLGVLSEVTSTIKQGIDDTFDKLNEVYDAHFKPFFDSVANGLSTLTGQFLDFWNGKVQPILMEWAADFDALWTDHIQPLLDNAAEFLGKIADLLKALWENILQPFIAWIIDNILPIILPIFDAMWNTITDFVGYLADLISDYIDIWEGVIEFLTGVFSGDWEKALQGIVNIAKGIISLLMDSIESGITLISDYVIIKLQELAALLPESGRNIVQGLIDGFLSLRDKVIEVWNNLKENILSTMNVLTNNLSSILNSISNLFTKTWQGITLIFQTFIDFLNWTVIPMWKEAWGMAENIFKSFDDMLTSIVSTITLMFDNFFNKTIKAFVDVNWKSMWDNAKNIFTSFKDNISSVVEEIKGVFTSLKDKISEIIGTIKGILESFLGTVSDIVSKVMGSIDKAGSASSQLENSVNGRSASPATTSYSAQSFSALTSDLPRLASGSVIRGGNPFMAILGDQPRSQVNVEAPLATIEKAVENVMNRQGYNRESVPVTINLNYDGETFARVSLSNILSELGRQGYNVDVLGVT